MPMAKALLRTTLQQLNTTPKAVNYKTAMLVMGWEHSMAQDKASPTTSLEHSNT